MDDSARLASCQNPLIPELSLLAAAYSKNPFLKPTLNVPLFDSDPLSILAPPSSPIMC